MNRTEERIVTAIPRTIARWLAAVALLVVARPTAAEDEKDAKNPPAAVVKIAPIAATRSVFGDREVEFKVRVTAPRAIEGRAVWRLALGTATVKAGEVALAAGPDAPATVALKLPIPPVKDGVVLHTRLTVSATDAKGAAVATFEQDLWVFPTNPFADRATWLKSLKLSLYDPAGATAKVLTAADVPFDAVRDVDNLAGVKEGVLVVGEGVSFAEEKGLAAALEKLVAGGVVVLCLAPSAGEIVVPGLGGPAGGVRELSFRQDVVSRLDKRLDPDGGPGGKAVASSLVVKPAGEGVVAEVTPGAAGWAWVEGRYDPGKGRLAVCGLAVVAKWEAGPTPRYLLARMLEHLTEPDQPKKESKP